MKQIFLSILIFALAVGTSPESVMRLSPELDAAFAGPRGRSGGMSRGSHSRPSGARTRPSASRPSSRPASRPSTRPSSRPAQQPSARPSANRPSTKPAARPSTQPANRQVSKPANRPNAKPGQPGNRPAGARPPGSRPPGSRPPGSRPPNAGHRPPGSRPPGARPPGSRPPGYRPPNSRPPGYRPPHYPPPYYRPPNYRWGNYYWNSGWGWFFTAALVGSTLVYIDSLPDDKDCQKIVEDGETLYMCDGVLYRSTYYEDEKVYEIVSDAPGDSAPAEPTSVVGLSLTDPYTKGEIVRDLQNRLVGAGYDVGNVDGVFGKDTESALQWYQYDNDLESTGVVDTGTAEKLGFLPSSPPATSEPASEPDGAVDEALVPEATEQADGTPTPETAPIVDGDAVPATDTTLDN